LVVRSLGVLAAASRCGRLSRLSRI